MDVFIRYHGGMGFEGVFAVIWLVIPYMTWLSRMAGGGWPKLPWGLDQWLLALPYLLFFPVMGYWVILGYLGAVLGLRSGHGSGFNYNLPFEPDRTPEKVEWLIPSSLPVWGQKALIMLLTGLAVTILPAFLLLANGHALPALVLCLSGALKAVAYLLPKTEYSEWVRGAFLGLGVVLAFMVL